METTINYSQAPHNYTICLNRECPHSPTCLRQIIEQTVPADVVEWRIISPRHLTSLQGTCPHYRSSAKVRYAKGFLRLLEKLPHTQMQTVILQLTKYFGRRTYYRVRRGERLISPYEQQQVINILENCGVPPPHEFDGYTEKYVW